jgi:hypothetical protein
MILVTPLAWNKKSSRGAALSANCSVCRGARTLNGGRIVNFMRNCGNSYTLDLGVGLRTNFRSGAIGEGSGRTLSGGRAEEYPASTDVCAGSRDGRFRS